MAEAAIARGTDSLDQARALLLAEGDAGLSRTGPPLPWVWFRSTVCGGRAPLLNYSGGTEIGRGILAGNVL